MKLNTTKSEEVLRLSTISSQCMLQVSSITLQQVEKFKYLGMLFTSDERRNKIDTRIGKANAVLRKLHRSVVIKRDVSKAAKLSVFETIRWDFCEEFTA